MEESLIRGNHTLRNEPSHDADNPMLRGEEEIVEPDYLTDAITDEAVEFIKQNSERPFCLA